MKPTAEAILTPHNVDVLMHYYTSPEPHERAENEGVQETIRSLCELGAMEIHPCTGKPRTTPLGIAWIKAICNVPRPRFAFLDEQGRVVG